MTKARPGKLAQVAPENGCSAERPWVPVSAQMHDHCMTLAGVPASIFYRNAQTFVETCQAVADYYGVDQFGRGADVYNFEIEAMGGRIIYSDTAMPTIDFRDPLIKQPEDLRRLKTPDFYRDGRLPYALECMKLSKTETGTFCGPFSMAVGIRTYPALVKDMRKRPEFAHELFTFIIDQVLIPYLKVQKEYCGISMARGFDAWASLPSLSVKEMNEWVLPYARRLVDSARELGIAVRTGGGYYSEEDPGKFNVSVVHAAFDVQLAIRGGNLLSLGASNWHLYPLEPVREYTAKYRARGIEITIDAGVDARVLRDEPVDKIVGTIKRYIDAFGRDHKLQIQLGNIPADTPSDHVHAAIAAVHTFGRLPIAANLDRIEFKPPERETFQEWKNNGLKLPTDLGAGVLGKNCLGAADAPSAAPRT